MNIFERVTNLILEALDRGEIPWQRPWVTEAPKNLVTKREYRGINRLLLSMAGFSSPWFLSFLQAKKLGGSIKKGEKGNLVVFYGEVEVVDKKKPAVAVTVEEVEEAETEMKVKVEVEKVSEKKVKKILKYSFVFNIEQCQLPERVIEALQKGKEISEINPIEACEKIVSGMPEPPTITFGHHQACYIPSLDTVEMPHRNKFVSSEFYYSTLFHEIIHSTGHEKRLQRDLSGFFGSEQYSREELIAEIGCSFLCNKTGISEKVFNNSVAYIQGWSEVLKKDKKLILEAASQSQKAVDYILGGKND